MAELSQSRNSQIPVARSAEPPTLNSDKSRGKFRSECGREHPNPWIAEKLNMGIPNGVSRYVGLMDQTKGRRIYEQLIKEIEV
jgi:hypothetical protein